MIPQLFSQAPGCDDGQRMRVPAGAIAVFLFSDISDARRRAVRHIRVQVGVQQFQGGGFATAMAFPHVGVPTLGEDAVEIHRAAATHTGPESSRERFAPPGLGFSALLWGGWIHASVLLLQRRVRAGIGVDGRQGIAYA
jgi:hypothetical protein